MDEFKNSIKEKIKNLIPILKDIGLRVYAQGVSLAQKLLVHKKQILIGVLLIVVLVGIGFAANYALEWWKFRNESPTFAAIRKAELAGTGTVGSKIRMGDLEITLQDVAEGTYRPLELDADGKRVVKQYLGTQMMIFNTGQNQKEFLVFGLIDERGGQYERDQEADFYLDDIRDFGPAREIYPRTIREGHLIFSAPPAEVKNLKLIIFSETTNKKAVFDIAR